MDAAGYLAEMHLSPGQDGDGPHGRELLKEFQRGQIQHVPGDAAYDGNETRKAIKGFKAKACIKPSKNRTTRKRYNKTRYKNRIQVERFSNRVKQCRRLATRYEKIIETFASSVWLAALIVDLIGMSTRPKENKGLFYETRSRL